MINVPPPAEPPDFDQNIRQPGRVWLESHLDENGSLPAGKRPPDRWTAVRSQLADGFQQRCGYLAMYIPEGTVDHYRSCQNHPNLAYEWSNYRYVSGAINASKGTLDEQVLDPFEVQDDWFEILLPSLQLVLTDAVPAEQRQRAEFTLQHLRLRDDEQVIRQRRAWHELYEMQDISLPGLEKVAPLIARAVRKQLEEQEG
jgi:hypothetical protein